MRGSGLRNRWTCGVQAALAVVMLAGHDCRIVLGEQAAVEGDLEEAAINLIRRAGFRYIPDARRTLNAAPGRDLAWLSANAAALEN